MFTLVVEFVNGVKNFMYGLNRVECNNIIEKYSKNPEISYVGVMDENF